MITSRLSRVISVLIHSNNTINPMTKMILVTEMNNYNNDVIIMETKIKNMENEIYLLKNSRQTYTPQMYRNDKIKCIGCPNSNR